MRALAVFLGCLLGANAFAGTDVTPANPHANAQVRSLLQYFHGLSSRTNKKILSGQFTEFGSGANLRLIDKIHGETGHQPAIIGVDYADVGFSLTTNHPNRTVMEYWKMGGIVTISAHMYNPGDSAQYGLRDTNVDLATLLDESKVHQQWMIELDRMAAGLQQLKEAGVVVLWRPFHEMNGGWFWWGGKDPELFIKVWRQMFDYFTETKKLDNLIWVYSPNHGRRTADYYAGDRYVDLVGLDAYTDFIDPKHIQGYDAVAALPKPFGFTEFGPHSPSNPPGNYDYRRLLNGIKTNFPKTCFFMSWNDGWSLGSNEHVKEFLDDPLIVNLEDLHLRTP